MLHCISQWQGMLEVLWLTDMFPSFLAVYSLLVFKQASYWQLCITEDHLRSYTNRESLSFFTNQLFKMTVGCKSTSPSSSPLAMIFLAVSIAAVLLCHPTAAAAQTETELDTASALTNALILGEESLVSYFSALLVIIIKAIFNIQIAMTPVMHFLCSCGCYWTGVQVQGILQLTKNWKQSAIS